MKVGGLDPLSRENVFEFFKRVVGVNLFGVTLLAQGLEIQVRDETDMTRVMSFDRKELTTGKILEISSVRFQMSKREIMDSVTITSDSKKCLEPMRNQAGEKTGTHVLQDHGKLIRRHARLRSKARKNQSLLRKIGKRIKLVSIVMQKVISQTNVLLIDVNFRRQGKAKAKAKEKEKARGNLQHR